MKNQYLYFLFAGWSGAFLCVNGQASQLTVLATPDSATNSIVFQMDGVAFANWYAVSNATATNILNRRDLTNLVSTYFASQNPTNFALYASLFESSSTPTNDGEFGAAPETLWFKGYYHYGSNTLLDIRFRYSTSNETHLFDTILPLVRSNSDYYLTSDLEDPALCLFQQERNQTNAWRASDFVTTNWSSTGYFAGTNYLFETNSSNPWIVWMPGNRFTGLIVTSNAPMVTNLSSPENVVVTAIQSLLKGDTNSYTQLIYPTELDTPGSYYSSTPRDVITNRWGSARSGITNGAGVSEEIEFGNFAYVTYMPLTTNIGGNLKSWLYLKRYNNEWRISADYNDNGNSAIGYLLHSCTQAFPSDPKVLP